MESERAYESELAELRRAFAVNLRRLRKQRFRRQEDFWDRARLHRTTVSKLEQAHTDPPLSTLLILAEALDVSLDRLAEGVPVPQLRRPPRTGAGRAG